MFEQTNKAVFFWLALAVLICYANSLSGVFQFDDYNVIVNNPRVHTWSSWLEGLTLGIRPLLKVSYTINWTMNSGVLGFHITNVLIHMANTFLVYLLTKEFIRTQWQADKLMNAPFCAALLFAVHPIHTEAVTYVCGRSSSLMTFFYLAGMLTYIYGRVQQSKIKIYFFTPLLFIAALSVKETAVTFPFALLLWEYACGGKWQSSLRQLWPSCLVLLVGGLIFILSQSYASQMVRSLEFNSLQGNAATQLDAFTYLLKQWMIPIALNIDTDLKLQRDLSESTQPLIIFAVFFSLIVVCWRRRPWVSFAIAWVMLQLIPLHMLLPRLDIANDRQMYLAGWPIFLMLIIELTLLLKQRIFQFVVIVLLAIHTSLTIFRNRDYASEISLWEDTAKKSPYKARVHNNLGYAYLLAHRNIEARREFLTALKMDPSLYKARYNLYRVDDEIYSSTINPKTSDNSRH
jgi:tetratricopeptide (TPR) repeat protein